jgi:hypothetical protein
VTPEPGPPAAQRYKDVIADLSAAADDLRERDRLRAAELARQLVDLDAAMARAAERAALSLFVAEVAWEDALDALWQESWMTLRRRPGSDRPADPSRMDELDLEVERAAAELHDAVRRRFWRL